MTTELKKVINSIHPISNEILDLFLNEWQIIEANKKEIITPIGKTEKHLYFINAGIQKAYYCVSGRTFNLAFSYPYSFTCVPESFLTQSPSQYAWECITKSSLLRISYSTLFNYVNTYPEFETLLRKKLIGTIKGINNRYYRILTMSMEERFTHFMSKSPMLINQIPQKEIANYLKIDPTNFSKLINNVKV